MKTFMAAIKEGKMIEEAISFVNRGVGVNVEVESSLETLMKLI